MSTGNRRPGILMMGAPLKYFENFSDYNVAEEMMTFKSGLYRHRSLISVKMISVCSDRSCASSTIMAEYVLKSGSIINSLKSIPSVMYLMMVFSDVLSSNLIEYPTSSPSLHYIYCATRVATDIAATLLG